MLEIHICMGSSCFSRGNVENLRVIRQYLSARGVSAKVCITGHLCADQCSLGPNLMIDGAVHHAVQPAKLPSILDQHFKTGGEL